MCGCGRKPTMLVQCQFFTAEGIKIRDEWIHTESLGTWDILRGLAMIQWVRDMPYQVRNFRIEYDHNFHPNPTVRLTLY